MDRETESPVTNRRHHETGPDSSVTEVSKRPNIAVAGLTAAGKTTHARLLASTLGYRYVSATEILLELIGIESVSGRAWFDHRDRIRQARTDSDVDAELDRQLVRLATDEDGLILDSWAVAWTCHAPMIRLWLDSDTESRTWKCYVSQGDRPQYNLTDCRQIIEHKDASARELFLDRHGFDLFTSRSIFDAELNNSHLIEQPTRRAADAGITAFDPVMTSVVTSLLDDRPDPLERDATSWTTDQRNCLQLVNRLWGDQLS